MRILAPARDYVAFNERADFTTVDFRDVLCSGMQEKRRQEVTGAILGNGSAHIRLPRNFTPIHLDSNRAAYGFYNIYEAAHWQDGKLHRWGIPKGYNQCRAQGRDSKGRFIAYAWKEDPEFGAKDAFVYDRGKFHLLREDVGIGDGSILQKRIGLWLWETDTRITLPAPDGYSYGVAYRGLNPAEYVGCAYNMVPGVACHWKQKRCRVLPLPKGANRASARGISRQGWVVGHASGESPWLTRSVLWQEGKPLLLQNCIARKDWQLGEMFGVTPAGVIFVSAARATDTERAGIPMLAALYPAG